MGVPDGYFYQNDKLMLNIQILMQSILMKAGMKTL
jgi:hypothetical protein